jgi:hypothetical protein
MMTRERFLAAFDPERWLTGAEILRSVRSRRFLGSLVAADFRGRQAGLCRERVLAYPG